MKKLNVVRIKIWRFSKATSPIHGINPKQRKNWKMMKEFQRTIACVPSTAY